MRAGFFLSADRFPRVEDGLQCDNEALGMKKAVVSIIAALLAVLQTGMSSSSTQDVLDHLERKGALK